MLNGIMFGGPTGGGGGEGGAGGRHHGGASGDFRYACGTATCDTGTTTKRWALQYRQA